MQYVACGMPYAAKLAHITIVSAWFLTSGFQFAATCGMRCENMNRSMSQFMRQADANSHGEIQKVASLVWEIQKLKSLLRVFHEFGGTSYSQQLILNIPIPCALPCTENSDSGSSRCFFVFVFVFFMSSFTLSCIDHSYSHQIIVFNIQTWTLQHGLTILRRHVFRLFLGGQRQKRLKIV